MSDDYVSVRFMHTIPNAGAVDVYLRPANSGFGYRIISAVQYGELSEYIGVPAEKQTIDIRVHSAEMNQPGKLVTTKDLDLTNKKVEMLVIAHGRVNDRSFPVDLLVLDDNNSCPEFDKSHLRFIHVAPTAPALDFYDGNARIFTNVSYGEVSKPEYVEVAAGKTSFTADVTGTNKTVLESANVTLVSQKIYTIVVIGVPNVKATPMKSVVFRDDGQCLFN